MTGLLRVQRAPVLSVGLQTAAICAAVSRTHGLMVLAANKLDHRSSAAATGVSGEETRSTIDPRDTTWSFTQNVGQPCRSLDTSPPVVNRSGVRVPTQPPDRHIAPLARAHSVPQVELPRQSGRSSYERRCSFSRSCRNAHPRLLTDYLEELSPLIKDPAGPESVCVRAQVVMVDRGTTAADTNL